MKFIIKTDLLKVGILLSYTVTKKNHSIMKYNLSTKIPFSEFYSLQVPILAFRLSNRIVIVPSNVFISTFLDTLGRIHTHASI